MRKMLDGSKMERGRKKRRKPRPRKAVKPAMEAQTMRRRNLLMGGSGAVCVSGPAGWRAATGLATPLATSAVGVETTFPAAPEVGTARAAGGVAAGKLFPGASPEGGSAETVPEEARRAGGVTTVLGESGGVGFAGAAASPRAAAKSSATEGR